MSITPEPKAAEAISKFTSEVPNAFKPSVIKQRFVPWYINRYIKPGRITPLYHIIAIISTVGFFTNYIPHLKVNRKYEYH